MSASMRSSAIVVAVAAALAIWAVARLAGVDLTVQIGQEPRRVGAVDVLVATLLAGVAARVVHLLLTRRPRTARWWPFIGSTGIAISMLGPSYLAAGAALIGMHLAVGYVLIAGFAKLVPRQAP
jgi:Family of unknown function (DUF6069)